MQRLERLLYVSFMYLGFFMVFAMAAPQEKVLTKEFSSPFKDVAWKPQPGVFKFGSRVREIKDDEGNVVSHIRHLGEDFLIEAGTPVLACADGYIGVNTDVPGTPERPQWGGIIVITHRISETVEVHTIYGHIVRNEDLKPGSFVRRGQEIGKVAKSKSLQNGWWDVPPHLHLQFKLDPLGKYEAGTVPPGNSHFRHKDTGKLTPFPAPSRMEDHIAPSEIINAENPVALMLKERADEKRKE